MAHRRKKKPLKSGVSGQVVPFSNGGNEFVSQGAAKALLKGEIARALQEKDEYLSTFEGQQAGVPGMGPGPEVRHEPAGGVFKEFLHPAFTIMEFLRRSLPEEGWFNSKVNPRNPIQFQLGSFTVPQGLTLWLFDYEYRVLRNSGVDPGDFIPAETGRYSNQIGFDLTLNGRRDANLSLQLDPQSSSLSRQEFEQSGGTVASSIFGLPPTPTSAFERATANSFASTAGAGTSLLPNRPNKFGPRGGPWTLVAVEGTQVSMNVVIFNRIRSPLAAVEGRLGGYLIQRQVSSSLIQRVRPR